MRKQDIGVTFFYYLGYSRIHNVWSVMQRRSVTCFLVFHDISPIFLGNFEKQMHFLKTKTNVVSMDDFIKENLSFKKINVVITFDDGYKIWKTDVIRILKKLNLSAIFFISSGLLNLDPKRNSAFRRNTLYNRETDQIGTRGLGDDDVRQIAEQGFELGGHTLNHCNLANMIDKHRIMYELSADKRRLEQLAKKKVDYFAYPFGAFQNPGINIRECLKKAGYKGAVTTAPGFNRTGSNPYLLNRDIVQASMNMNAFKARITGNYAAVHFIKRTIDPVVKKLH